MESNKTAGNGIEEQIRCSSDDGLNGSQSFHSCVGRFYSEERNRRRRKTKKVVKNSLPDIRTIESHFEADYEERLRDRIKTECLLETGLEQPRFHFEDSEWYLPIDELGLIVRSDQARMTKTIWEENVVRFARLYRAALMGDWEVAEGIFNEDFEAITAGITLLNETALHVAVGTGHNLGFVEKLVNLMCKRSVSLTHADLYGNTAFAVAAIVGNVKAAKILVRKNETLPAITNRVNYSPLHLAAKYGHRDMVLYLLSVTKDEGVFTGKAGARLLNLLITFDIYDIALDILHRQPDLAVVKDQYGFTALQMLAEKPDVFQTRNRHGLCERSLHRC